jgi:hypothetical protein
VVNEKNAEEPERMLFFGKAHPRKGLGYLFQAQPLITQQVPKGSIIISAFGEYLTRPVQTNMVIAR